MKPTYFIIVFSIVCGLFSCKNADKFEDKIYFAGTDESNTLRLSVDIAPIVYAINVSASSVVDEEVTAQLDFDNGLVDSYNRTHGTDYKPVPNTSYELSSYTAVIEAGNATSDKITLTIHSLEGFQEGTVYLLPIKITSAKGLPVLEANGTIYLVINRTIITPAADFNEKYFAVPQFRTDPELDLSALTAFTFETKINVHMFKGQSYPTAPKSVSVMGIEEVCLLRFGDANVPGNKLQISGGWTQKLTSITEFNLDTWYHVAVTYDGTILKIYVDGNLDTSVEIPGETLNLAKTNPATTDLTQGFFIGRAADNIRPIKAAFSETRVWRVARTQNELRNNVCYVNPNTPGLVAYWRFNEGSGTDVNDYSPNHLHIKSANGAFPWVEGVRCEP